MGFNKLISEGDDFLRQDALNQLAEFERVVETLRPDAVISNEELNRHLGDARHRTMKYLASLDCPDGTAKYLDSLSRPKPLPETTVD